MSHCLNIIYCDNFLPPIDKDKLLPELKKFDRRISEVFIARLDLASPMAYQLVNRKTGKTAIIADNTADKIDDFMWEQRDIAVAALKEKEEQKKLTKEQNEHASIMHILTGEPK